MQTFGRVLASLGVALTAIGAAGAIATLPTPVPENAGGHPGERRQTPRKHLPEMPGPGDLITGISGTDCAAWALMGTAADAPGCAAEDPPGDPGDLLFRSNDAAHRFSDPVPEGATR